MAAPADSSATPVADRSVRIAWVADAPSMGAVQGAAWRAACSRVLPPAALDLLDDADLGESWAGALRRPPSARHRALVALEGNALVGFAATGPADDPDADPGRDAEMTILVLDPTHHGRGHGSRLLAAVADTARTDGFRRLTTWVHTRDDVFRAFLESAGWAADGAHRELVLDDRHVPPEHAPSSDEPARQVRLHTSLEES